jgi:predicted phosphodiesterase
MSYTEKINAACNPITILTDSLVVSSDWHIPYVDEKLFDKLMNIPAETDITRLAITGDLFDADSYSRFTPTAPTVSFKDECNNVRDRLEQALDVYSTIYICRGNHERRVIDMNMGKFQMKELIDMAIPDDMSKKEFDLRVKVTNDDHLHAVVGGRKWLLSHPRNFRIINLSVARDLASRYQCSQIVAHGHQLAQGWDRSGTFRLIDGGGLFDKGQLAYLRDTTCYPETKNGFIILDEDDKVVVVEGQ